MGAPLRGAAQRQVKMELTEAHGLLVAPLHLGRPKGSARGRHGPPFLISRRVVELPATSATAAVPSLGAPSHLRHSGGSKPSVSLRLPSCSCKRPGKTIGDEVTCVE